MCIIAKTPQAVTTDKIHGGKFSHNHLFIQKSQHGCGKWAPKPPLTP